MTGLQSGEGRMMIDSVVWAQHINVTDTQTGKQTDRQTDRHIAIANAAPTHGVGRQRPMKIILAPRGVVEHQCGSNGGINLCVHPSVRPSVIALTAE